MNIKHNIGSSNCRFCEYLSGNNTHRDIDKPWFETDKYAAFVSQGAFIPGWTIIVPKTHTYNMSSHYGSKDFIEFCTNVSKRLETVFGKTIMFEHGPLATNSPVGCGTDHAHIHMVSISIDILHEVNTFSPLIKWESVDLTNPFNAKREYLLFSQNFITSAEMSYLSYVDEPVSQYFRKVLANQIGLPELYNYRIDPMFEEASRSLKQLKFNHYLATA